MAGSFSFWRDALKIILVFPASKAAAFTSTERCSITIPRAWSVIQAGPKNNVACCHNTIISTTLIICECRLSPLQSAEHKNCGHENCFFILQFTELPRFWPFCCLMATDPPSSVWYPLFRAPLYQNGLILSFLEVTGLHYCSISFRAASWIVKRQATCLHRIVPPVPAGHVSKGMFSSDLYSQCSRTLPDWSSLPG